ncbi:hypothetical protein Ddye_001562 [Dipteronia dyeriana]|uniref:Retrotransposon gag domain-containing protein n=1 Tax=Dipteronia dyeriana TaxID=168575 RepID=A0AAD9XP43_9ROSI|nr:hypothetical protein Ddye_001559 [Dipteronia dyeriana]KAK2662988.1 hypothetical protein Ddye_001562 [Dipteronia dyeriana]
MERLQQSVEGMVMSSRQDKNIVDNMPCFDGLLGMEEFLDWLAAVESIFVDYPEDKKVKLITCKLRGAASSWWHACVRHSKIKIKSWQHMKQLMISRFLPIDYKNTLFRQYLNCCQGDGSVQEYVDEFYRLSARTASYGLQESEYYLIAKFIVGLRDEIRDKISPRSFHPQSTLSDAIRLATLVEQQQIMHESQTSKLG